MANKFCRQIPSDNARMCLLVNMRARISCLREATAVVEPRSQYFRTSSLSLSGRRSHEKGISLVRDVLEVMPIIVVDLIGNCKGIRQAYVEAVAEQEIARLSERRGVLWLS